MKNIVILKEVQFELERFKAKLEEAIKEQEVDNVEPSKKMASAKRAALDLKNELTKLTQIQDYKWTRK